VTNNVIKNEERDKKERKGRKKTEKKIEYTNIIFFLK